MPVDEVDCGLGVAPLETPAVTLTRRGRLVLVAAFLAVLASGLAVGGATVGTASPATAPSTVLTVQPGQTLWSIAHDVAPGVDPRITVERLVAVNGLLDADAITAGDQLTVPVAG